MKKIKLKISYYDLQELLYLVNTQLEKQIQPSKKALSIDDKIAIDQYLGLRQLFRKKAVTKETIVNPADKFKIELRYTEAVYLLRLMNYTQMPLLYTEIDTTIRGLSYLIENL